MNRKKFVALTVGQESFWHYLPRPSTLVAKALGLSDRMARELLKEWVNEGWLSVANRARAYALSAIYWQYIGGLSAVPD